MKLMKGWLNTGHQKGLLGEENECPSCGWHEETQLHVFQCREDSMKNTRMNAFKLMEEYYHQHGIPGMVYVPFIKLYQSTCNDKPMQAREPVHRTVEDAIHAQCNLGHDFFLRWYLAREWLVAIQHFQKDKPEEKCIHLYLGLWGSMFAAIWEQRNATLHGESSLADKYEREKITTKLLEWKHVSRLRLGHEQQYLTDYNEEEIKQWKTLTMRETVKLLVKAAQNLIDDMLDHDQQRITKYFTLMNLDEDWWWNWCTMLVWSRHISREGKNSLECNDIRLPHRAIITCIKL